MRTSAGFGIVEVLVGMVVLALGVMFVAQLQASGLRFSSKAESLQNVTVLAQAELDYRIQFGFSPSAGSSCLSVVPDGYQCTVQVTPCELSGNAFDCNASAGSDAYEIVVTATGPRNDVAVLRTLVGAKTASGSGGGTGE